MIVLFAFLYFFVLTSPAHADGSQIDLKQLAPDLTLEPITVSGASSFDSLSNESDVPVQTVPIEQNRTGTLDSIAKQEIFPSLNYGYPSGANGVSLGGRTIDDTQVFTLGVPLNLPQGGGADLSVFPAFLWSEAKISPTLTSAGFAPSAASGSLQLVPWTRNQLRERDPNAARSRLTVAYDRMLQTYSLGTRVDRVAILAGMSTGLQTGPAGSFSADLLQTPHHQLRFHLIGSDQDGDSPGSRSYPSPDSKKKTWRVLPVLESHQEIGALTVESTLYGDLQDLQYLDPTYSSETRTQQYGLENAILYGPYTLALSARYTRFYSSTFGDLHEWPLLGSLTREFTLNPRWSLRLNAGVDALTTTGASPLGRISVKDQVTENEDWFFELNTIPKLPTLSARYYVIGTYHGNPDLKPERVNALLFGHEFTNHEWQEVVTIKGELRSAIQVNENNTTENAGNASLLSLKNDLKWKVLPSLRLNASTLITRSRLKDAGEPYPDLPYFSQLIGARFSTAHHSGGPWADLNLIGRYIGHSRTPDTTSFTSPVPYIDHPDYFLWDTWITFHASSNLSLNAGVDNLFNNRADVVFDYPLPGRIVYLSLQAQL